MILIYPRYFGSIARCNFGCGALIGYTPEDVSKNSTIRCPQCGAILHVNFDPNYDGTIKDQEKN